MRVRLPPRAPPPFITPDGVIRGGEPEAKEAMFTTYILYSERLKQYYTGHTEDFSARLHCHNQGGSNHTSKGIPWVVVYTKEFATRKETAGLERHIKRVGVNVFLKSQGRLSPSIG